MEEEKPDAFEEVTGPLFQTAVSEDQLQEAQNKTYKRLFGSSQVFLDLDDKPRRHGACLLHDIVKRKVTEHYENGLRSMHQGQWEKAVISFSKAITLDPEKVDLYVKRAQAFLQLCDFQSAALNLQKACSVAQPRKEDVDLLALTYFLQGQSLYEQKCFLEALESFTRASELQPWNSQYQMHSISCLEALGRHAECIHLVNKKLEEEQGNPDLYVMRARLYDHLTKATLSYKDVETALSLNPHQTEAQALHKKLVAKAEEAKAKAVNHAVQSQLQEALSQICFAIENNPSSAEYHIFRGTVYKRLKDFSAAVDDFVVALQLCNENGKGGAHATELHSQAEEQLTLTYNDFAVHCYTKGFYKEGVQLLNKALKGERNKKEFYVNRGDCFFQLGEMSFALADYEQAFELDATNWGVRTRIAKVLDEMGLKDQQLRLYQKAEHHFSEAIKQQPFLPELYFHRAQARRWLQRTKDAEEDAVITIVLKPDGEEAAPAMMNFFPGKTMGEILASKLAQTACSTIGRNLEALPGTWKNANRTCGKQAVASRAQTEELAVCVTEEQLIQQMVLRRRKVNAEIQTVLHRRGQLCSNIPHAARPQPEKEEPCVPKAPYQWKTFSLGLKHPGE